MLSKHLGWRPAQTVHQTVKIHHKVERTASTQILAHFVYEALSSLSRSNLLLLLQRIELLLVEHQSCRLRTYRPQMSQNGCRLTIHRCQKCIAEARIRRIKTPSFPEVPEDALYSMGLVNATDRPVKSGEVQNLPTTCLPWYFFVAA